MEKPISKTLLELFLMKAEMFMENYEKHQDSLSLLDEARCWIDTAYQIGEGVPSNQLTRLVNLYRCS